MIRVLVLPGGTELGREVFKALRYEKDIELVGGGVDEQAAGAAWFEDTLALPNVTRTPGWYGTEEARALKDFDFIYPAHDDVIYELHQIGVLSVKLVAPPAGTCIVTRFKRTTWGALEGCIPLPRLAGLTYPVFVRPNRSQGSRGAVQIENQEGLDRIVWTTSDPFVTEFLPGDEFTVDCFSALGGTLRWHQVRERLAIRNGISVSTRSTTRFHDEFGSWAHKISTRLPMRGAWFFQAKLDKDGNPKLLEVGPRIGGGAALARACGINLPLLSLYVARGIDPVVPPQQVLTGAVTLERPLENRYVGEVPQNFDTVYVDLDDTLLIHRRPNYMLIALIHQFIEEGRKIVLITRAREATAHGALNILKIATLFNQVIPGLSGHVLKVDYMRRPGLLIDDSFRERHAAGNAGHLVFDASSAIELFLRT